MKKPSRSIRPLVRKTRVQPDDSGTMGRVFSSNSDAQDEELLTAAKKAAHPHGATVVKSLAGTTLLAAKPAKVHEIAQALPGWRYSVERKTTRVPKRKPLARPEAQGPLAATPKG